MTILTPEAQKYLQTNELPGELIEREEQQERLRETIFNPLKENNYPSPTTYIFGSSGTGKTVTVEHEIQKLREQTDRDDLSIHIINGRSYSTYHQVLVKLVDDLQDYFPVEVRGETVDTVKQGWPSSFAYEVFTTVIQENDITLLLMLDELDKLKFEGSKQIISMFYDLKSNHDGELPVQLITISNNPHLKKRYPEDIQRRISNKIHFPTYNAQELTDILYKYAEVCLEDGTYTRGKINELACKLRESTGSAQRAKEMLYHVGQQSEDELSLEYMEEAEKQANKNMLRSEINSKPTQHRLAYSAVAQAAQDYENAQINGGESKAALNAPTSDKIYEEYKEICEEKGFDPKTKRSMINYIDELESDSLVSTNVKGLGRGRGISKLHKPMADPDMIIELVNESLPSYETPEAVH